MCENQSIYRTGDLDLGPTNLTFDRRLPMIDMNVYVEYREDRIHSSRVTARKRKTCAKTNLFIELVTLTFDRQTSLSIGAFP